MKASIGKTYRGQVHCPICTHTVNAEVEVVKGRPRVVPGQKCTRCSAPLDAGIVLQIQEAA